MHSSLTSFLFAATSIISVAHAYPIRTHVPWAILLCQFSDSPPPMHDATYITNMYLTRGAHGMADYWNDVSYANIDLVGSVVKGWYTIAHTQAEEVAKARWDRFNDCVAAAKSSVIDPYSVPPGYHTLVITSPGIDEWGADGAAFLPEGIDVTGSAHETGHGIGMIHTFSDDPNYRNVDWAQIGEYDDEWDMMSAANVYTTSTTRFGSAPPGLNGFGLDRAGWLPISRTYTFGQNDATSVTVKIAALNHPEVEGNLLVRVPFDPSDLMHYYTIELRNADGWDAGIPGTGGIMLHEVKLNPTTNYYQSYLLREHTGDRTPLTSLNRNGVTIAVNWVDPVAHQAEVTITGDIAIPFVYGPTTCMNGYVWREADDSDHVCVTPGIRTQTAEDNAAADSRVNPSGGPYGPNTCLDGYVWREAFLGDQVCVVPSTRGQATADNAAASSRIAHA